MQEQPDARRGVPTLSRADRLAVAGVVLGSTATLATAVVAWALGSLTTTAAAVALVLGATLAFLGYRATPSGGRDAERWTRWEWLALAAFAAVSIRQFGWLVFERGGALLTLLPHNYGDLPLHWTYIQHFASGAPFWPENPILAHERLRYPLGVDLLAAAFLKLGARMEVVLPAMGLAGAALVALALRAWGGAFAVAAFLLSGGVSGLAALAAVATADVGAAAAWKNLFLALLVPQRGFLLALPAGLALLSSWRAKLLRGEPGLPGWVEGLVWGALPLVHLHTFAFVSVLGAAWAVASGRWRAALGSLAVAFVPATWGVVQVTDGFRTAGLVGWAPGWTMGAEGPAAFLFWNFGIWLPLAAAALVLAVRARRHEELLLLVPALGLFVALFFVRLAPWAWDNTKVMLWCYVLVLPALFGLVLERLARPLRGLVLVLLFVAGAQSVAWACLGRAPRLEVLDRAEHTAVCRALGETRTDRVATAQTFNHPVALCGRKLVAGYGGHLWSHGLDHAGIEARLSRLMRGEPGWVEDARALGASHVFWGPREAAAFPGSARPWASRPPLASGAWGALYALD